jgi:ADP-ribosylglycohydrolase
MNAVSRKERVLGGLWGALVGDALGVPVEFKNRAELQSNPVDGMRGHGTHHQPAGTWSDDGALTLCIVDSLLQGQFDPEDMGRRFVEWMDQGLWSARGDVFDIGMATCDALRRIAKGAPAEEAGGRNEHDNGNGSLMRILPLGLRFSCDAPRRLRHPLERASAITHGHPRSRMACVFYGLVTRELMAGSQPQAAIASARTAFADLYEQEPELRSFNHVLHDDFGSLPEAEIVSTGYVLHTLHASLWCLIQTASFEECVLQAVNLGGDTDTTACVAGGLAGVAYGVQQVPESWRRTMARTEHLEKLFTEFADMLEPAS